MERQIVVKNRWKVLPIVLLGPLMGSLDASIVNVALPAIAKDFQIGFGESQWIASSYLIVISALILIFGKMADLIGRVKIFNWGFVIFGIGSLFCAFAWSLPSMIVARAFQAIGAAMFMASNQAIIASIFPPHERGQALGLMGTIVAIGTMAGPPIGGLLATYLGWPWLFLINVPISIFAFTAGRMLLPKENSENTLQGFDRKGSALFVLFIVCLFYLLLDGQDSGWVTIPHLISLAIAIGCFVIFLAIEKQHPSPLLDLSMFRSGIFSVSVISVLVAFSANFCVNITQPFYLQDVVGFSPALAGMILLASPLMSAIFAPLGGYLADRYSPEPLTVLGLLVELVSLIALSTLKVESSPLFVVACLAIFGIGVGLFNSPNTKIIMASVPKTKLGVAGSINALARNVGMVSGIAIAVSVTYAIMSQHLGYKVPGFIGDHKAAYVAGMREAVLVVGALLVVAICLTFFRLLRSKEACERCVEIEG